MNRIAGVGFLVLFCSGYLNAPPEAQSPAAVQKRIARIENAFPSISMGANEPPIALNLQRVMQISNVPGLSVAVIDDYRIAWAKGYGVTEAGGKTPVTARTLFPAASISKPVTAIAALRLVEQGKLSLDDDVNRALTSWKVPENEYTRDQKVTLRRILSHTAGTTVHGFLGYPVGQPLPTLLQILDGIRPANSEPVRVDYVPGTKQRYSGGGVMIEQQLMIDVTGQPFPRIMQELVLDRLGLKDSTFEQPLPPSRAAMAAAGHNDTGDTMPGKWNVAPEMAVGGLWTTPSDLARIAIDVALSSQGKSNRILSTAMSREMLRPQVDPKIENLEGRTMRMGLGWILGDESDPGRFGHEGVNPGFMAEVLMWESGHGVVVMVNNWSFNSQLVMRYVINNVAKEYGWSYRVSPFTPPLYADTEVLAVAKLRGARAAIRKYYELKKRSAEQKGKGAPVVVWASDPPDFPPNEWDLLGVAGTLADPRHLDDAIAIMKVELEEYPKFPKAYHALAKLYIRAGRKAQAMKTYETLLAFQPDDHAASEALETLRGRK